jgi:hypothetical protein
MKMGSFFIPLGSQVSMGMKIELDCEPKSKSTVTNFDPPLPLFGLGGEIHIILVSVLSLLPSCINYSTGSQPVAMPQWCESLPYSSELFFVIATILGVPPFFVNIWYIPLHDLFGSLLVLSGFIGSVLFPVA